MPPRRKEVHMFDESTESALERSVMNWLNYIIGRYGLHRTLCNCEAIVGGRLRQYAEPILKSAGITHILWDYNCDKRISLTWTVTDIRDGNNTDFFHIDDLYPPLGMFFKPPKRKVPEIEKVIYNNPATIILWTDGTKTVVKKQEGDTYDPEKGLAMAIAKKALGNESRALNDVLHKWEEKV